MGWEGRREKKEFLCLVIQVVNATRLMVSSIVSLHFEALDGNLNGCSLLLAVYNCSSGRRGEKTSTSIFTVEEK